MNREEAFQQKIESLSRQLEAESLKYKAAIEANAQVFTEHDQQQFSRFMEQFWAEQKKHIAAFFHQKYSEKARLFENPSLLYQEDTQHAEQELNLLFQDIKKALEHKVARLQSKHQRIDAMANQMQRQRATRTAFNVLKQYHQKRQYVQQNKESSRTTHQRKVLLQVFTSWRNQTYKEGYRNRLQRAFHCDLNTLEDSYKEIVNGLQQKIEQTEELIRTKKAAEQEFTYSIQRNILKTIGNLQMEVQSLGKGQVEHVAQNTFMQQVRGTVQNRLSQIEGHRH